MLRSDLLALSLDDLSAIATRGVVKRAQKEVAEGSLKCEFIHSPDLCVQWSDGIVCTFPTGKTIQDAICSSGTLGISRHIVRSVIAYQLWQSTDQNSISREANENKLAETKTITQHVESTSDAASVAWNPGDITDAELEQLYRSTNVAKARKLFQAGVLVELTLGKKPTAKFLHQSCTVRFPVPGDIRYARGDCADAHLSRWIMLAVWSFRELPPGRTAGLLSLGKQALDIPEQEMIRLEELLSELAVDGVGGINATWQSRISRLEVVLRDAGLTWPADLTAELLEQIHLYKQKDARFNPLQSVRLLGELVARTRSILNPNSAVPPALVRGNKLDVRTEIKSGRLIGLGLKVRPEKGQNTFLAYFQDADTGTVVALRKVITDPVDAHGKPTNNPAELRSFHELSSLSLGRGPSLSKVALSQLMLYSGKRTPSDELILPRGSGKWTVNPQTFQWEQLLPPVALSDFSQCRQRMEKLPPDWLRPRRHTEDLHVFPISKIEQAHFDEVQQHMTAVVVDHMGENARLIFPYLHRGQQAFNQFYNLLKKLGEMALFIVAHVTVSRNQLQLHPVTVIYQDGEKRLASSPWLENQWIRQKESTADHQVLDTTNGIDDFLQDFRAQLGEVLITGLPNVNTIRWDSLQTRAQSLGLQRIGTCISEFRQQLEARANQFDWNSSSAVRAYSQLCFLNRVLW